MDVLKCKIRRADRTGDGPMNPTARRQADGGTLPGYQTPSRACRTPSSRLPSVDR